MSIEWPLSTDYEPRTFRIVIILEERKKHFNIVVYCLVVGRNSYFVNQNLQEISGIFCSTYQSNYGGLN